MKTRTLTLLALLAGACQPIQRYPSGYRDGEPLWDPRSGVPTADGLYLRLPASGGVALVAPGEEPVRLDLGHAYVTSLQAGTHDQVIARSVETTCEVDVGRKALVEDCPDDRSKPHGRADLLGPNGSLHRFDVGAWYGAFNFSEDGRFAVAAIDPSAPTVGGGLVNLTSVLVLDSDSGKAREVSVGFAADRVLFINDGAGVTTGMIVLSQSEVAVVDLSVELPLTRATFPLTLDTSQKVVPVDVALTPDNAYAMITIKGSSDLYVLDLTNPSINIVALSGQPSAMLVDPVSDQTFLSYAGRSRIDVVDHARFDVESIVVSAPTDHLVRGPGYVLAYSLAGGTDAYRVDTTTLAVDAYHLTLPPTSLALSAEGDAAVLLTAAQSQGRLEVLDLRAVDGNVDVDVNPFGLDTSGVGVIFTKGTAGDQALVLQRDVDTLYALSWPTLEVEPIELSSPPAAIGAMADGTFFVTHDDALGLVSFLDADLKPTTVGGFARLGLFDRPMLTEVGE